MSTNIIDLTSRLRRPLRVRCSGIQVYHCVLISDEVSFGELVHALRGSDIVLSTDEFGNQVIHRKPTSPEAA
jgi:hypothetical protein